MEVFTYGAVREAVSFKSVERTVVHSRLVLIVFCLANVGNNMQLIQQQKKAAVLYESPNSHLETNILGFRVRGPQKKACNGLYTKILSDV